MHSYGRIALGVFLAGGILLFAVGLFWIGDRRQLFSSNIELETEFQNVSGLTRGAQVSVGGLDAGEVLEIRVPPSPGMPFRVRFRVNSQFQSILRTDSVTTILTDGLVGNRYLKVEAGTDNAPRIEEGTVLPSREPVELGALLERANETVLSANEAVTDIRDGINQTVEVVIDLNRQTTEVIGEVGNHIDAIAETGRQITGDVGSIVESVRNGQGSIGKLLTDDALYNDLRSASLEAQGAIENVREMSGNLSGISSDLREISSDIRSRDIGDRLESIGANVETLTGQASQILESFQSTGSGGLMTDVRETLTSTNRAMANLADNTEALKRNFLFSGFFDDRGFFDIDAISLGEYQDGRFLADRQRIAERLDGAGMFRDDGGRIVLSESGMRQIDSVIARYMRYSKNDPLVIESYTNGTDPAAMLRAHDWATAVRDYLLRRFELKRAYVGVMPMRVSDLPVADQTGEGIGLVLFAQRGR